MIRSIRGLKYKFIASDYDKKTGCIITRLILRPAQNHSVRRRLTQRMDYDAVGRVIRFVNENDAGTFLLTTCWCRNAVLTAEYSVNTTKNRTVDGTI